jgi:hypothetical protein
MKTKTFQASELHMPAAEFDNIMRKVFQAPAKALAKGKVAKKRKARTK